MTEKRYYAIDETEYDSYWVYDISNCKKTKEDFPDKEFPNDMFDIYSYYEYIHENGKFLESKKLIDLLNGLSDENEQLKQEVINLKVEIDTHKHPLWSTREAERIVNELKEENEQLKKEKPFLKIHNDYFIQYGDDRELFSMHKPSDIRSLMYLINRENGYSELQSQYNDLEMVE